MPSCAWKLPPQYPVIARAFESRLIPPSIMGPCLSWMQSTCRKDVERGRKSFTNIFRSRTEEKFPAPFGQMVYGPSVFQGLILCSFPISLGPNWPQGGEIDIVEGVGDYTNNQATIHTNPGCSLTSSDTSQLGISGSVVGGTNCAAAETNNQGCGVRSSDDTSYGSGFNGVGGGVYASSWSSLLVEIIALTVL
jgi:hypothetical protein